MARSILFYELGLLHAIVIGWAVLELRKTQRLLDETRKNQEADQPPPDDASSLTPED